MGEANLSSKLSLTNGVNLMIMAQVICYNLLLVLIFMQPSKQTYLSSIAVSLKLTVCTWINLIFRILWLIYSLTLHFFLRPYDSNAQNHLRWNQIHIQMHIYIYIYKAIVIDFLRHTLIPIYDDIEAKKYFSTHTILYANPLTITNKSIC